MGRSDYLRRYGVAVSVLLLLLLWNLMHLCPESEVSGAPRPGEAFRVACFIMRMQRLCK